MYDVCDVEQNVFECGPDGSMVVANVMCHGRMKRARSAREDSSIHTYIYIYMCIYTLESSRALDSPMAHDIGHDHTTIWPTFKHVLFYITHIIHMHA